MDLATIVGMILAWGALLGSMIMEGGDPAGLINIPAAILVFGGTLGATMMCFPLQQIVGIPMIMKHAFIGKHVDPGEIIGLLVSFAEKARREGLLVLEEEARGIQDEFLQKGINLAIDGTDPEVVREILQTDIAFLEERHKMGESVFSTAGGFGPTLGVIGTVMGLVHMLHNLSDPGSMGPAIAGAFIATLYGVSSANLIFLPLGKKLHHRSADEILIREMMVEGILSIQSGDNPRIVADKLKAFLAPKVRNSIASAKTED
ncbi:MAG: flagellar motor protein [Armatimonadetes bacterium]|nr:flagellar motor protein [Armatimonadota bacterium]